MDDFKGLMLGDQPIYFDLGLPKGQVLLVNPERIVEAVEFLLKATGQWPAEEEEPETLEGSPSQ